MLKDVSTFGKVSLLYAFVHVLKHESHFNAYLFWSSDDNVKRYFLIWIGFSPLCIHVCVCVKKRYDGTGHVL